MTRHVVTCGRAFDMTRSITFAVCVLQLYSAVASAQEARQPQRGMFIDNLNSDWAGERKVGTNIEVFERRSNGWSVRGIVERRGGRDLFVGHGMRIRNMLQKDLWFQGFSIQPNTGIEIADRGIRVRPGGTAVITAWNESKIIFRGVSSRTEVFVQRPAGEEIRMGTFIDEVPYRARFGDREVLLKGHVFRFFEPTSHPVERTILANQFGIREDIVDLDDAQSHDQWGEGTLVAGLLKEYVCQEKNGRRAKEAYSAETGSLLVSSHVSKEWRTGSKVWTIHFWEYTKEGSGQDTQARLSRILDFEPSSTVWLYGPDDTRPQGVGYLMMTPRASDPKALPIDPDIPHVLVYTSDDGKTWLHEGEVVSKEMTSRYSYQGRELEGASHRLVFDDSLSKVVRARIGKALAAIGVREEVVTLAEILQDGHRSAWGAGTLGPGDSLMTSPLQLISERGQDQILAVQRDGTAKEVARLLPIEVMKAGDTEVLGRRWQVANVNKETRDMLSMIWNVTPTVVLYDSLNGAPGERWGIGGLDKRGALASFRRLTDPTVYAATTGKRLAGRPGAPSLVDRSDDPVAGRAYDGPSEARPELFGARRGKAYYYP